MPMAPRREVSGVAHDAVRAPRNDVRVTGMDVEAAAGAEVRLDRLDRRDGLHVPDAVTPHFRSPPPGEQAGQFITVAVIRFGLAALRAVTARHDFSLGDGYDGPGWAASRDD